MDKVLGMLVCPRCFPGEARMIAEGDPAAIIPPKATIIGFISGHNYTVECGICHRYLRNLPAKHPIARNILAHTKRSIAKLLRKGELTNNNVIVAKSSVSKVRVPRSTQ